MTPPIRSHHAASVASVRRLPAAVVAAIAALATVLTGLTPAAGLNTERVIVSATRSVADAAAAVLAEGGRVVERLDIFGIVVADVPTDRIDEVTADPATAVVTPDVPLHVQSGGFDAAAAAMDVAGAATAGATGDGVGVVLVDTGIDVTHPDLAGKVVGAIDLTSDNDGLDHHGHGTFLAGLVAGSGAASDGAYAGVAPDAHLVSVKVAGADGSTTLSTVIQGLVAADRAREQFDAPVVLLALSGPAGDVPDPVMLTLEMLWARGSTVIVAAGNNGSAPGSVGSPGADPYLITVGSVDDHGTADLSDDTVAEWSGRGPTPAGFAKPDVIAPGVSVIGLRNTGSTIDVEHPSARIEEQYFRGSGTSMSAALAAGAAAAVLSADSDLSPDEVKGRLIGSARPVDDDPNASGAGVIDVAAAVTSTAGAANTDLPPLPEPAPGRGKGSDWDSRPGNGRPAAPGARANGNANGLAPAGWSWAGWSWAGWSWADESFAGWSWADADEYWAGWSWAGWSWTGWSWTAKDFAGDVTPAGWSWTGGEYAPAGWTWAGWSWTGWSWSGWTWAGWTWTGWTWAGWTWTGWTWSGWTWTGWTWSGTSWG